MDCEYVESVNFKSTKIRLVSDKNGCLFVRKNVRVDSLLAEKLTGISSPYIVKFIEFGEDNDGAYVIEEYVEGVTAAERSFTKKQAVKILIELCDALDALHSAKIVHRDIKPSNIIITKDEHIKLIDFDASRIEKVVKDRDTQILGTEGFAPPEQFGFSQTDSRSDIYSFGVTMNLLLGENSMPFNKIIKKCKALDPNDRYDSISKVKTAIRLTVLKRLAAIPAAALLLIVFTTVFSVVLRNRDFTDHTGTPYSESYISSVSNTTQPLPIDSQPESGKDSSDNSSSGEIDSNSVSTSSESLSESANSQSSATHEPNEPETPHSQSSTVPKPLESSLPPQGSQTSEPQVISENPKITYTTVITDRGTYEDICDYVFYDDPAVHGIWNYKGYIETINYDKWIAGASDDEFMINDDSDYEYGRKSLVFFFEGTIKIVFNNDFYHTSTWTNGYYIWNGGDGQTISEYFIVERNGIEYLFIEHKSGDYLREKKIFVYHVYTRKK